jgi:cell division protein FtsL
VGRLNFMLLLILIGCAVSVVTSQHQARKLFIELEAEQALAKKLDEERSQLQLEQSTWATHKRVEAVAAKSLGMKLPEPASTVILTLPEAAK